MELKIYNSLFGIISQLKQMAQDISELVLVVCISILHGVSGTNKLLYNVPKEISLLKHIHRGPALAIQVVDTPPKVPHHRVTLLFPMNCNKFLGLFQIGPFKEQNYC